MKSIVRMIRKRDLVRSEGGAMMLICVFMAIFMVGGLVYMSAVGDAILFRERMQDASDAGAFAGSVVNARGMNFIVFLNVLMAIVVSIILALKTLVALLHSVLVVLTVIPGAQGAIKPVQSLANNIKKVADKVEKPAKTIVKISSGAQKVVRVGWPAAAQGRAIYTMTTRGAFKPPAKFGFIWPIYKKLPVEEHEFKETCDRGAGLVRHYVDQVLSFLDGIPLINKIKDLVVGAVGAVAKTVASFYCDGDVDASHEIERKVWQPFPYNDEEKSCHFMCGFTQDSGEYARHELCESHCGPATEPACPGDILLQVCIDSRRSYPEPAGGLEASEGDYASSGCSDAPDPAACRERVVQAGLACGPFKKFYTYLALDRYILQGENLTGRCVTYVPTEDELAEWELLNGKVMVRKENPCGPMENWNPLNNDPFRSFCNLGPMQLVTSLSSCPRNALPIDEVVDMLKRGDTDTARFKEHAKLYPGVPTEIYDCPEKVKRKIPVELSGDTWGTPKDEEGNPIELPGGAGADAGSDDWKPPMRVKEDTALGDQAFQIRAFLVGADPRRGSVASLKKILYAENARSSGLQRTAQTLGNFSIAQSEYFWNGEAEGEEGDGVAKWDEMDGAVVEGRGHIEWMWDIRWRARLRMVHFPSGDGIVDGEGGVAGACEKSGAVCDGLAGALRGAGQVLFSH